MAVAARLRRLWNNPGPDEGWSWVILVSGWIFMFLTFGICRSGAAGVIFVELLAVFDVTRKEAMWPFSVLGVAECIGGLISGVLTESFDGRIILFCCAVFCTLGLALNFWAENLVWLTFVFGVLFGLGESISMTVCFTFLTQYFKKRLSTANGIYLSSTPISGFVLPPIMNTLFRMYGLRGGLLIAGGMVLQLVIAAALHRPRTADHFPCLLREKQKPLLLLQDEKASENGHEKSVHRLDEMGGRESYEKLDDAQEEKTQKDDQATTTTMSLLARLLRAVSIYKEVVSKPMFYVVTMQSVAVLNIYVGFALTMVDFVMDGGGSRGDGVILLTIFSLSALAGRFVCGVITDRLRVSEKRTVIVGMFVLTVGFFLIGNFRNFYLYCVLVVLIGISEGCTNSLINILYKKYLGQKGIATCIALRLFVNGLFAFVRPMIAGSFRTNLGSYTEFYYFLGSLSLCSLILWMCEPLFVKVEATNSDQPNQTATEL